MPWRANCRAAVSPAAPAPMMATLSCCWGEPLAVVPAIRVAAVIFVSPANKADAKGNVERSNKVGIGRRSKERQVGKRVERILLFALLEECESLSRLQKEAGRCLFVVSVLVIWFRGGRPTFFTHNQSSRASGALAKRPEPRNNGYGLAGRAVIPKDNHQTLPRPRTIQINNEEDQ